MFNVNRHFFITIIFFSFFSCSNNAESIKLIDIQAVEKGISKDSSSQIISESFQEFKPNELLIDSIKYFIIEGDLLLNEYEYMQYKIYKSLDKDTSELEPKLVGEIRDNKVVKWENGHILKYSVMRKSFRTNKEYEIVRDNIKKATNEWEQTCNIKFYHDDSKDNTNSTIPSGDLTFVVLGFDSRSKFIASAFFPYYSINRRRILIDPSYFTTSFDKVGVLRHELGHVLGFRHEHIRSNAPLVCQGESTTGTIDLTKYDPKSVMHYFCGGMGNIKLEITEVDKLGSQSIYGAPKK